MAKKKVFTPELQKHMQHAGYDWRYFEIVNEQTMYVLVRNKQTKEIITVRKVHR